MAVDKPEVHIAQQRDEIIENVQGLDIGFRYALAHDLRMTVLTADNFQFPEI
jgi:hypothetical protein